MRQLSISVNPEKEHGVMRNILGMVNSTTISWARNGVQELQQKLFDDLHVASVHHHDAALENPGYALIDVSRIFPMFSLDPQNPEYYDFAPTDDYLKLITDPDVVLHFRLGESIEHSANKYRVKPPKDYEKWVDICINIIRHYTEGWANGMHLNIQYLSLYEEPNDGWDQIFAGPFSEYCKLYVIAHKKLQAAFPHMKIGGPNAGFAMNTPEVKYFLQYALDNGVRPAFISGTFYEHKPGAIVAKAREMEQVLKEFDMEGTELFFMESHLRPRDWRNHFCPEFLQTVCAAYSSSSLIRLMDTITTYSYHYGWGNGNSVWGCWRKNAIGEPTPLPVYHGLKFFTDIVRACKRVEVTASEEILDIDCLAGRTEAGTVQILVSCFETEATEISICVPGYTSGKVRTICDDEAENSPAQWQDMAAPVDGKFKVTLPEDGSRVWLMEFFK